MAKKLYTPEMIEFVRGYAPGHWMTEITSELNKKFNLNATVCAVKSLLSLHKIKTGARHRPSPNRFRLTTAEQDELVRQKFHQRGEGSYGEVQAYLKSLGVELTVAQVKSYLSRKHISLGTHGYFKSGHEPANKGKKMPPEYYDKIKPTMFKPGNRPHNWKPVGTERITRDGYVEVKISEPKTWRLKARIIWEEATGEKLTRNDRIIYLDGNKLNLDISNLAKLTGSQLARLNQNHLHYDNAELTKLGITVAKLLEAKGLAKKGKRSKNNGYN